MGGLGLTELAIVFAIVVLLCGARWLPELGAALGRSLRRLTKSLTPRRTEDIALPDEFPPMGPKKGGSEPAE